jgi:hypothetical protein
VEDDQASSIAATIDDDGDEIRSWERTQSEEESKRNSYSRTQNHHMISSQLPELPNFSAMSGLDSATNASPIKEDYIEARSSKMTSVKCKRQQPISAQQVLLSFQL